MKTAWTQHLRDPKEKKDFEDYIKNSGPLLKVLTKILQSKVEAKEPKTEDYASPSWAYLQADRNGYTRALKEVMELIYLGE